jgi:hypothetical protein
MTDKDGLTEMPFRLNRRQIIDRNGSPAHC